MIMAQKTDVIFGLSYNYNMYHKITYRSQSIYYKKVAHRTRISLTTFLAHKTENMVVIPRYTGVYRLIHFVL